MADAVGAAPVEGGGSAAGGVSEDERNKIGELADAMETRAGMVELMSPPFACSGCGHQNSWQRHAGNAVRIKLQDELHDSFGTEITVHARLSTDKVGVVKEHVSAVLGVSAEQLELSHEDTGRGGPRILRSEAATLQSEGVQYLDVLTLTFSGSVTPPERVVSVELPPSLRAAHRSPLPIAMPAEETIGSLKAPLARALGVQAARLTLRETIGNVLSDGATLRQAGAGLCVQLRLSLPGDSEADAARCAWVESETGAIPPPSAP